MPKYGKMNSSSFTLRCYNTKLSYISLGITNSISEAVEMIKSNPKNIELGIPDNNHLTNISITFDNSQKLFKKLRIWIKSGILSISNSLGLTFSPDQPDGQIDKPLITDINAIVYITYNLDNIGLEKYKLTVKTYNTIETDQSQIVIPPYIIDLITNEIITQLNDDLRFVEELNNKPSSIKITFSWPIYIARLMKMKNNK